MLKSIGTAGAPGFLTFFIGKTESKDRIQPASVWVVQCELPYRHIVLMRLY